MKTMKIWAALLAAALASAAAAQSYNSFEVELETGLNGDYEFVSYENDPSLKVVTRTLDGVAAITSTAQLDYGVNKVSTRTQVTNPDVVVSTTIAYAHTQWFDEVTIDGGELNGTLGTFTAALRVFGNESFDATGAYADGTADLYGFWDSWIGTSTDGGDSYLVGGWFGSYYSDGEGNVWYDGDELNQPMTDVTLEFVYGEPFLLSGMMDAYFDTGNDGETGGTLDVSLDFSHSAYWNGIREFRDANGNLVSVADLTSASGIDWRRPVDAVPEPASMAALGFGLVGLARRRAIRSRKS